MVGPPTVIWQSIPFADLMASVDETYVYNALETTIVANEITGAVNQGVLFTGFAANPVTGDGSIN